MSDLVTLVGALDRLKYGERLSLKKDRITPEGYAWDIEIDGHDLYTVDALRARWQLAKDGVHASDDEIRDAMRCLVWTLTDSARAVYETKHPDGSVTRTYEP